MEPSTSRKLFIGLLYMFPGSDGRFRDTFTFGQKPPVVLVPGTGSKGCETYSSNFIKLFQGVAYADPVWLNIPGFLLDDAQNNAVSILPNPSRSIIKGVS